MNIFSQIAKRTFRCISTNKEGAQWYNRCCGRKDYWLSMLGIAILSALIFAPQFVWGDSIDGNLFFFMFVTDVIIAIFLLILAICLSIQRLNDAGISKNVMGILFPIVILVGWVCKYLDYLLPYYIISCMAFALVAILCCLRSKSSC